MTSFKRIFLKGTLTTTLNEEQVEKKTDIKYLLPKGWTDDNFDYESSKDKGFGSIIKTGCCSGIIVLDFAVLDVYLDFCKIYPQLVKCYTVKTRKGYHVYFNYNENVKKVDVKGIDTQSDGKCVFAHGTKVIRYNCESYSYFYMGGEIRDLPDCILEKCIMKNKNQLVKKYASNNNYSYEIFDDECREVLEMLVLKFPDYFSQYQEWLTFTCIMKGINKLDMWDEFSQQSDNYNKHNNMQIWHGIKQTIPFNFFCKLLGIPAFRYHKVVDKDALYDMVDSENYTLLHEKYLKFSSINLDADVVIIESGTGTGKTTVVSQNFFSYQFNNPHITLLSITNLISLSDQQVETFRKNNVEMYSYLSDKVNPSLLMMQNSVICVNSLHKLASYDFRNKIIYIDEIHALCNSLTHNENIKHHKLVFNTLLRAIKTCHKVVVSEPIEY